jgi:hypothetical protein
MLLKFCFFFQFSSPYPHVISNLKPHLILLEVFQGLKPGLKIHMRLEAVFVTGWLQKTYLCYCFEFLVQKEKRKEIDIGSYKVGFTSLYLLSGHLSVPSYPSSCLVSQLGSNRHYQEESWILPQIPRFWWTIQSLRTNSSYTLRGKDRIKCTTQLPHPSIRISVDIIYSPSSSCVSW